MFRDWHEKNYIQIDENLRVFVQKLPSHILLFGVIPFYSNKSFSFDFFLPNFRLKFVPHHFFWSFLPSFLPSFLSSILTVNLSFFLPVSLFFITSFFQPFLRFTNSLFLLSKFLCFLFQIKNLNQLKRKKLRMSLSLIKKKTKLISTFVTSWKLSKTV